MTGLTRWDPFREFSTLQDRMNRLFRDSFNPCPLLVFGLRSIRNVGFAAHRDMVVLYHDRV